MDFKWYVLIINILLMRECSVWTVCKHIVFSTLLQLLLCSWYLFITCKREQQHVSVYFNSPIPHSSWSWNNIHWPYLFSPHFKVNAVLWACFSTTWVWGWLLSAVSERAMLHKQPFFPQTLTFFLTHAPSLIHWADKRLASSISSSSIQMCATEICTNVGKKVSLHDY